MKARNRSTTLGAIAATVATTLGALASAALPAAASAPGAATPQHAPHLAAATYPVEGGIASTWWRLGGPNGWLGQPTSAIRAIRSAASPTYRAWRQDFAGGTITFSEKPGVGGRAVSRGAIGQVWLREGGEASRFGLPVAEEHRGGAWGTYVQRFERGTFYWSAPTGAHWVEGGLAAVYAGQGNETAAIGLPSTGIIATTTGWYQNYRYGRITFNRNGTWSVSKASSPQGAGFNASYRQTVAADVRLSYRPGCPVGPAQLRTLTMNHWGFDGRVHAGTMVVNADVVVAVRDSFAIAYTNKFPIRVMQDPSAYNNDDFVSMRADNTYAFSCRQVTGTPGTMSPHSYGRSIDVNTVENPYRVNGVWYPENGRSYVDRTNRRPGMLYATSSLTQALRARGWTWYEGWDYQHFNR